MGDENPSPRNMNMGFDDPNSTVTDLMPQRRLLSTQRWFGSSSSSNTIHATVCEVISTLAMLMNGCRKLLRGRMHFIPITFAAAYIVVRLCPTYMKIPLKVAATTDSLTHDFIDTWMHSITKHGGQREPSSTSTDGVSSERENSQDNQHQERSFHVLCFGDSLTAGYYNHGHNYLPYSIRLLQHLTKAMNYPIIIENKGLRGEKAHVEMTDRLSVVLRNSSAFDLVIILGGTNDIFSLRLRPKTSELLNHLRMWVVPTVVESVQLLHRTAWATGATTLLLTIPANFLDTEDGYTGFKLAREKINDDLARFALENSNRTIFCDLARKLHPVTGRYVHSNYWDDGLHLTPEGYSLMADIIFGCLRNSVEV